MSSRAGLPLVTFVVWKCQLSLMGIMNELVGQRLSWDQKWNRDIKLESFIDSGLRGDCEGSHILNIARRPKVTYPAWLRWLLPRRTSSIVVPFLARWAQTQFAGPWF